VARDDAAAGIQENRIIKSEFRDTGGYLRNLGVGVVPGLRVQGMSLSSGQCSMCLAIACTDISASV
jgi:hypothetical protein